MSSFFASCQRSPSFTRLSTKAPTKIAVENQTADTGSNSCEPNVVCAPRTTRHLPLNFYLQRDTHMPRSQLIVASFFLCVVSIFVTATPSFAADRVALVIGNGLYQKVPALPNPTRDATDIGRALERLNFKVTQLSNASAAEMRKAIVEFGRSAEGSEVAIVYYAGHGYRNSALGRCRGPVDRSTRSETARVDRYGPSVAVYDLAAHARSE